MNELATLFLKRTNLGGREGQSLATGCYSQAGQYWVPLFNLTGKIPSACAKIRNGSSLHEDPPQHTTSCTLWSQPGPPKQGEKLPEREPSNGFGVATQLGVNLGSSGCFKSGGGQRPD